MNSFLKSLRAIQYAAAGLLLLSGSAIAAQPGQPAAPTTAPAVPYNWLGFKASADPQDKKLVADIEKMKWWEVCIAWGREWRTKKATRRSVALRERLVDGRGINDLDIMNVFDKKVVVGMITCGVNAALGRPDDINRTMTAGKTHAQLIYSSRSMYVYTEAPPDEGNGIVSGVQW
jgi:hypothetical protein